MNKRGFCLLELLFALLLFTIGFSALFRYQQWLHQRFLSLIEQHQAEWLAYHSLEMARAHQGERVDFPILPTPHWRRQWQRSAATAPCHTLTVTIIAPTGISARLSQQWCPAPVLKTAAFTRVINCHTMKAAELTDSEEVSSVHGVSL